MQGLRIRSEHESPNTAVVTKKRDEACIGNQKLEQESSEGTHA